MRVRYSFGARHTGHLENIAKQRVKFPVVMKEVIKISEIVLEVVDARFFEEMRNVDIENEIKAMGKKVIYVLNKADLVDVAEVEKRIPKDMRPYVFVSAKSGKGANDLRSRIKMEAKRVDLPEGMKRVHVGVVGYPNAGKSSIINLITRRGVAQTSAKAGYTKGMQKIKMSEGILILDTPGVIPESRYTTEKRKEISIDAKLGARTYSDVKDPEDIVAYLVKDNSKKIEKFYDIKAKGDSEVLIEELGKARGFLSKGGKVDIDRTARLILKDWQEGRIK